MTKFVQERLAASDTNMAMRFIEAVEAAHRTIAKNPMAGFLWGFESPRLRDVRAIFVPKFPSHFIFIRGSATPVRGPGVIHASRDITREFERIAPDRSPD